MFNRPQQRILNGVDRVAGQMGVQPGAPVTAPIASPQPMGQPPIAAPVQGLSTPVGQPLPVAPVQQLPTPQPQQPMPQQPMPQQANPQGNNMFGAVMAAGGGDTRGLARVLGNIIQKRRETRLPTVIAQRRAQGLPTPRADQADAAMRANPNGMSWYERMRALYRR